jgi:hypothetical protein
MNEAIKVSIKITLPGRDWMISHGHPFEFHEMPFSWHFGCHKIDHPPVGPPLQAW